ncbi:MAG: hypothetical protein SFU99_16355 [Saprospiraceae bacterium]|nr:hypothetical protein [Saprospiraceae bacterium]
MSQLKLFSQVTILLILFSLTTYAQKNGGIYYFLFTIDEQMVNELEIERKGGGLLSGYSEGLNIPEYVTDSIKSITTQALSDKLKANVQLVYTTTEKGKEYKTTSMNGGMEKESLEDFPFATFKKAAGQHKLNLYVEIQVSIEDGRNVTVDAGSSNSRLKPMIDMQVKAYDQNKKVIWQNEVKLKKFDKLKQKTEEDAFIKVRTGETLQPDMILAMYQQALAEIIKD